ncbi:23S rRNA (pseudouridine(1915)-N(3))-methyltransferase RlmH [Poritiphilus flavus]|uniref:Ribosomal RNA large subunit methyltransferase H n=1 Tax=Poritiphilus flavus TaxID=2697053 RepID=A0A6L9EAW1_9FLAO|nr:23S rRNA (pseudouridine(1915)-N(3))-methyltransferase RlmH [Poritiphilus flavus]NAS11722.1 23S rRNA (pseudouridine(1915)-N(3))-methyltransferase RlmH [Poritiphilus flavus]
MNIKLITIGKTDRSELQSLTDDYIRRLSHYLRFEMEVLPDIKNTKHLSEIQQKQKEGQLLLSRVQAGDRLLLLDERGKQYNSVEFAQFLQQQMNSGLKRLVFAIGGPYGFSEEVYQAASGKLSLSKMTFSHQMIRLFAVEQMYRAMTILRNEPYHHGN